MPGCELYAAIDNPEHVFFNFIASQPSVPYTLTMPSDPAVAGVSFTVQSAVIVPGINPFGFISSNAIRLIAGLQ